MLSGHQKEEVWFSNTDSGRAVADITSAVITSTVTEGSICSPLRVDASRQKYW